jgi:ADP-ribose pyrophosphatase YjhB (NUDIX family)
MKLQVGVKVFLKNEEGKLLILKRSSEKYKNTKGIWDIVGGRINPGVNLLENLKREVKEETRLDIIGEIWLIFAQDIIMKDERDTHVVRLTYIAKTKGEPILDLLENVEYQWLFVEEIKKMKDLDIYVKEVINSGLIL